EDVHRLRVPGLRRGFAGALALDDVVAAEAAQGIEVVGTDLARAPGLGDEAIEPRVLAVGSVECGGVGLPRLRALRSGVDGRRPQLQLVCSVAVPRPRAARARAEKRGDAGARRSAPPPRSADEKPDGAREADQR